MAFAATNIQKNVFGSLKVTTGDWTGSVGDTPGSVTVEGGRVYLANFSIQDTDSPTTTPAPFSTSGTSGTQTISVYYHEAVTTGRFLIIHS